MQAPGKGKAHAGAAAVRRQGGAHPAALLAALVIVVAMAAAVGILGSMMSAFFSSSGGGGSDGGAVGGTTEMQRLVDAALGNEAAWMQLRQLAFCADAFREAIPDVAAVRLAKVPGTPLLYVHNHTQMWDIVSRKIMSDNEWDSHEVKEMVWAMRQPLPSAPPKQGGAPSGGHSGGGSSSSRGAPTAAMDAKASGKSQGLTSQGPPSDPSSSTILFVDVGANIGWFTVNMAANGFRVAAFEAMHHNRMLLRNSLCANPTLSARVALFPHGLGDKEAECRVYSWGENQGNGMTLCDDRELYTAGVLARMTIRRLDDVLGARTGGGTGAAAPGPAGPWQWLGVKMDVEGFEPAVLRGAAELFGSGRVLWFQTEFHPRAIEMFANETAGHYLKAIIKLGFVVSWRSFQGPFLDGSSPEQQAKLVEGAWTRKLITLYCIHESYLAQVPDMRQLVRGTTMTDATKLFLDVVS